MSWVRSLALVLASTFAAPDPGGSPDAPKSVPGPRSAQRPLVSQSKSVGDRRPGAKAQGNAKRPNANAKRLSPRDAGPRVLTRAEMDRPRSEFLTPPTERGKVDRYAPKTPDWRNLPPWRQAAFFGIRAEGQFFVYVIDCSESMLDDDRFVRAAIEARRSVLALQSPQNFEVIFYNEHAIPMPGGPRPRPADPSHKNQLRAWLRQLGPIGGTDPREAVRQALGLRPSAVFLLSDGLFPDGTVQEVVRMNSRLVPIHCVDLAGGAAGDQLRRIARASGGTYASRPGSLHASP